MVSATHVEEEGLIRDFVSQTAAPAGVRLKRIDQDADSTGEPALRIFFSVSRSIPVTPERIRALRDFADALQDKIFALKLTKWPFVHFVEGK